MVKRYEFKQGSGMIHKAEAYFLNDNTCSFVVIDYGTPHEVTLTFPVGISFESWVRLNQWKYKPALNQWGEPYEQA